MHTQAKLVLSTFALALVAYLLSAWYSSTNTAPTTTPAPMASLASKLKFVTVAPTAKHTATVVFVHGLGDSGNGIKPIAQMISRDPALAHVKWIMPHAPVRSITANMGMSMPGWFDIYSFGDFKEKEDEKGFAESAASIDAIIASEVEAGIEANRIVLGGFSQGGAMSLLTGLTKRKLAGVSVLSGWLPLRHKFQDMALTEALSTPIFWGYGSDDPLVIPKLGEMSTQFLVERLGIKRATGDDINGLQVKVYPGLEHSIDADEIKDWASWLKKVLPA